MNMFVMQYGCGLCVTISMGVSFKLFLISLIYFGMFVCGLDVGFRYVVILFLFFD